MKYLLIGLLLFIDISSVVYSQTVEDIRWKTESQVRDILGDPQTISEPTGTHATYVMWQYKDHTVAFANSRAFHFFKKDSLKKIQLKENR